MSRLVKGAPSSVQKDQPDQKKIYMDWANHYLRKAHYTDTLSDLHECVQGDYLPKIIHAVVQSTVPGITVSPATDEERIRNIKCCIRHLEAASVNCSSFPVADLSEGNMKAILSLFYSLSQFKRITKTASSPSRIARPVSPGLKHSHGVSSGTPPQTLTNGIASGAGMGGASKSVGMMSSLASRRTAGSSIMTSTVDKSFGARRSAPYKNLILSGEKPAALDTNIDGEFSDKGVNNTSKLHASLSTGGSTSRLDHLSVKPGIQGVKPSPPSQLENNTHVTQSQPNLHRMPNRSKSDPRLIQRSLHSNENRKDSLTESSSETTPARSPSSLPKRMLKQPSVGTIATGRSTPVDRNASGHATPSKLSRPPSRLNKQNIENKIPSMKELSSDESETERSKNERKRSNSEVRRPSALSMPRSVSRTGGGGILVAGSPVSNSGGMSGSRGALHKSMTDSKLVSPGSVPSDRVVTSSEPGTTVSGLTGKKIGSGGGGLQAPLPRKSRAHNNGPNQGHIVTKTESPTVDESVTMTTSVTASRKKEGVSEDVGVAEKDRPAPVLSKLSKPSSLQRFGAAVAGGVVATGDKQRKSSLGGSSTSGLSKLQAMSSSHGFIPITGRSSKVTRTEKLSGNERGRREVVSGSNSSLDSSDHEGRPSTVVKLDKQVSSTSSTGSSTATENEEHKMMKSSENATLVAPRLAGGKDNRRISPEGMSPDGKTRSNESITDTPVENKKNSLNKPEKQDLKTKLITDDTAVTQNAEVVVRSGMETEKVGGVIEAEIQTANLSQGSEVATDSTLSSLSLASVSSPPPHSCADIPPLSSCQQPETGQAAYTAVSTTQHSKISSLTETVSHDSHVTSSDKQGDISDDQGSPVSRHFNPLRSPLTKEKEKAKRARSLSPKSSRRIYPLQHVQHTAGAGPSVSISHHDKPFSPTHPSDHFAPRLELSRMDSPESVKSDVAVSAYSSARKPLRSSLRTTRDKDSSSSSLDSGNKVHIPGNKVTISPRSSQVVYHADEAGLQLSTAFSQPTILSPAKRLPRGRPSSLSDNCSVNPEHEKRGSTTSEKMDYSTVETFLSSGLSHSVSHQRYDSTPELLQTFENELSTMKKDLANKDRMLNMYENSMADLSSKVHHLKKSLEEKDQEIKHLTESKHSLFDLDGRSLTSRMSHDVLSDGCLSDSAMEPGHKGDEKKKKKWKRWSFRRKAKDTNDLPNSIDAELVYSGKSGRSLSAMRRHPSKSKSDLMSISEFSPDMRMRDADSKSYMSDFMSGAVLYSNDDIITVYEDTTPGAKAPVTLLPGYSSYMSCYGGRNGVEVMEDEEGTIMLGTISIAPEISWITMDTKICDIFMHHINALDCEGNLSLTEDSILHYFIADQRREIGNALLPPLTPYQSLATGTTVRIVLRGVVQGSCDALAYKMLINTETLKSYVSLLMETQWLVVMGTKGTCKTNLAMGLSRHLMHIVCDDGEEEGESEEVVVINYNVEKDGLEKVIVDIRESLSRKIRMWHHPPIITIDNIYDCAVLEQILTVASNLPRRPYIISTLCTATMQGVPLHQLLFHHQMRVVTCNPQTEPVFGILSRSLRKQVYKLKAARIEVDPVVERLLQWLPYLLEHLDAFINRFHTQTVSLGPRVFMDCAVDQNRNELETWFINLWNHFVIPYLMGAIMAGIETYTADPQLEWVDVREFVVETYPWQPSVNVIKLRTLNPEDVGWNHAVRPQQNRFMVFKDDMKLPDDTRSLMSRMKIE